MTTIRGEMPGDAEAIRDINLQAFDDDSEADLVDRLRVSCSEAIALVAQDEGELVGHILFTPAIIEAAGEQSNGMGLAPMSVRPDYQRRGIGSKLVSTGLDLVRESGAPFVIVLGHPEYYPRFGFAQASEFGIRCEFEVADDMFMILPLREGVLHDLSGIAKYHREFDVWK